MIGTQAEFARHLGVARSTITRAVKAGRLSIDDTGLIDFDQALDAWHNTRGGRSDVAARHAAQRGANIPKADQAAKNPTAAPKPPPASPKPPSASEQTAPPLQGIDLGSEGGRQKAQTARMHYENSEMKLAMAIIRGLRYYSHLVKRESSHLGDTLRAGIERVIDQTAPRLAAARNAVERRRILDTEIRKLRWMAKREMPRALRRMQEQGRAPAAKVGAGGTAE